MEISVIWLPFLKVVTTEDAVEAELLTFKLPLAVVTAPALDSMVAASTFTGVRHRSVRITNNKDMLFFILHLLISVLRAP